MTIIDVSIIIINYKTGPVTKIAVDKALAQTGISTEVIVVDNASGDDSAAIFRQYGERIIFIASDENSGYGKGCNLAVSHAHGRYYCLLNPDAYFTHNDDILRCVNFMDKYPAHGVCGVNLQHGNTQPESSAKYRYPGDKHVRRRHFNNLPGEIAWIYGAMLFVRQQAFAAVRGFDADYFLYAEDTDLSLRIRQAGFSLGHCRDVVISHIGGVSSQKTDAYAVKHRKIRGTCLFFIKHYDEKESRRLLRLKFWSSTWRLFILRICGLFRRGGAKEQDNYQRHKAIVDVSCEFLRRPLPSSHPKFPD